MSSSCYGHNETRQLTRQRPAEGVRNEQELDTATFDDLFAMTEEEAIQKEMEKIIMQEEAAAQQLIDLELATDTEAAKAAAAAEEEAIQKEMEQIMQEEAAAR